MWGFLLAAAVALGCLQPVSSAKAGEKGGAVGAMLAGPTLLGQSRTIVPVRVDPHLSPKAGERTELVIEGLAYDAPPGVLYEVLLQAPDGRRAPVGTISFYNRTAPGYGAATDADDRRTFDVSEALRTLGGQANALVFQASPGVAGPGISGAAHPGARVRFASVWLK